MAVSMLQHGQNCLLLTASHEVLTYPAIRAPWAILGYSDELHRAFKKDPHGFCAAVEERRRELQ
jgi:hypothetical protein